jgi:hypothetical protein
LIANNHNKFSSFIEVVGNGKPVAKKRLNGITDIWKLINMVQYKLRKDYSILKNNLPWTPAGLWNHCKQCANAHARQAQAGCETITIRLQL